MISTAFGVLAAGKVVAPSVMWSPTFKGPTIVLSGGDAVATKSSGINWESVLGNVALSGTTTFNVLIGGSGGNFYVGVGNSSTDVTSFLGADAASVGLLINGFIFENGGSSGVNVGFTYTSGDTITVGYNQSLQTITFAKNGGSPSAPFSVTGLGTVRAGASLFDPVGIATLS